MNTAGLKACRALSNDGIKTNVTLIFQPTWHHGSKAGATCFPFIGRLDDVGTDGMNLIADVVHIFDNYQFDTEVLMASIRIRPRLTASLGRPRCHDSHVRFDKLVAHLPCKVGLNDSIRIIW